MRNAMICVSVMLAAFLGWPLAFGGHGGNPLDSSSVEARPPIAAPAKPAEKPKPMPAAVQAAAPAPGGGQPESCYHRYQREVKACTGNNGAACRLKSADNWDLCEARGVWPD